MKRVLILFITALLVSNCSSIMKNMMMKKMKNMSAEEKKEMMIEMMGNKEGGSPCSDMMEEHSGVVLDDSSSMADKASLMLPVCFESILLTVDDEMKAQYLTDMINKLIENGYCALPEKDKSDFKQEIIKTIEELENN